MLNTLVIGLLGHCCQRKTEIARSLATSSGQVVTYRLWLASGFHRPSGILYVDIDDEVTEEDLVRLQSGRKVEKFIWLDDDVSDISLRHGLSHIERDRIKTYKKLADQRVVTTAADDHLQWMSEKLREYIFAYRDFLFMKS